MCDKVQNRSKKDNREVRICEADRIVTDGIIQQVYTALNGENVFHKTGIHCSEVLQNGQTENYNK